MIEVYKMKSEVWFMGYDVYCFIEKRIGDEWLVCREDGSLFDQTLTLEAYKEAVGSGDGWKFVSMLGEIYDACSFDIPRYYAVYYCLFGWEDAHDELHAVIKPQFKHGDASNSFVHTLYRDETNDNYFWNLTLQDLLSYDYDSATVTAEDGMRITLKKHEVYYKRFQELIERMMKVDAAPQDIRVIMRIER